MSNATNILTESVISLAEAARELPRLRAGRGIHPSTLWRWSRFGVTTPTGRIRLETTAFAGRVATSLEAVQRFLSAVAAAKAGTAPAPAAPSPKTKSHIAAKSKLDALNTK